MVSRYRKMLNVTANPREKVLVPWRQAKWHCASVGGLLIHSGWVCKPSGCVLLPTVFKNLLSLLPGPRKRLLNVKTLRVSPVLLFPWSSTGRKRGVSTYPIHSRGPCCSFWISFVSEWKKNSLRSHGSALRSWSVYRMHPSPFQSHLFILLHVKCSSPSRVCFN